MGGNKGVQLLRTSEAAKTRYDYGVQLENSGMTASAVSKVLGYADVGGWTRFKANYTNNTNNKRCSMLYGQKLARTAESALERYNEGVALEANGYSEEEAACKLGYRKVDSWRAAKKRFGGDVHTEQKTEAITEQKKQTFDFYEKWREEVYEVGLKAIRWLSPKWRSNEMASALLDLLIEESNRE